MATVTYKKGKLYDLPIIDLKPDPNQPRKSMDAQALEELVASIKTHGIIQPILFRVGEIGGHDAASCPPISLIIVAGERRYKAAQQVGLATLPGICVEGNPSEIALVENMLRQDLTPVEEAEGLQALMTEQKYTQEQLGGIIGKAQNTLGNRGTRCGIMSPYSPGRPRRLPGGPDDLQKRPRHHRQKEAGPEYDVGLHRLQGQAAEG